MHDTPERHPSDPPRPADPPGSRPLSTWLPVVLWAGVIFTLSSIPGTRLPTIDLPQSDKIAHALLYGVLGGLLCRALDRSRAARQARARICCSRS